MYMRNHVLNSYIAVFIVTVVAGATAYGLVLECYKIDDLDNTAATQHELSNTTSAVDSLSRT